MRAAALVADGSVDRLGVRERIEAALELERGLMSGARVEGAAELAGWIEESVRRILREAALGELGTDLNEAADETLIATGLASGDAEIAVTVLAGLATKSRIARMRVPRASANAGAAASAGRQRPRHADGRKAERPTGNLIPGGSEAAHLVGGHAGH